MAEGSMKITLYQAHADKQNAIMLCTDEDGVIDMDRLNAIDGTFEDRCIATVAVCKTIAHGADALKAQRDAVMAEFDRQIKCSLDNIERLKTNLLGAMKSTGTLSIKSDDGMLCATLYPERDESVEIEEGMLFAESLCTKPKPPAPSKTLIKAAILRGEAVAGARIVRHDRLVIK